MPPAYEIVHSAAAQAGLGILGAFHTEASDDAPAGAATLLLLGPEDDRMWAVFAASPEASDGAPDPLDRWSARVIGDLARRFGAAAAFPFGGPPHAPFLRWAVRSGRAWPSPLGMVIHDTRGLRVSWRGALGFAGLLDLPPAPRAGRPCDDCYAPCLEACPVRAFDARGYVVDLCRAFIGTTAGADCLGFGCRARLACPVGRDARDAPEQARFHMEAFLAVPRSPES